MKTFLVSIHFLVLSSLLAVVSLFTIIISPCSEWPICIYTCMVVSAAEKYSHLYMHGKRFPQFIGHVEGLRSWCTSEGCTSEGSACSRPIYRCGGLRSNSEGSLRSRNAYIHHGAEPSDELAVE